MRIVFAEFPTYVTENSAHSGSVILDCTLSLNLGLSTIQYYTFRSTTYLLYYNLIPRLQKIYIY